MKRITIEEHQLALFASPQYYSASLLGDYKGSFNTIDEVFTELAEVNKSETSGCVTIVDSNLNVIAFSDLRPHLEYSDVFGYPEYRQIGRLHFLRDQASLPERWRVDQSGMPLITLENTTFTDPCQTEGRPDE